MKKIYISLFSIILAFAASAQVDRSKMPEPGPAPKIELGETQSFTLENGLKVFVVENHKLPQVAYSLVLDIDPLKEGSKSGMSDLAGDMISKGTKNMSKEDMNFAIDFIGARFFTSASSVYGSSLKKHQEKLLSIMSDVVKNADFKQEELDKLKTQYLSGIQSEKDDPDAIARNVRRVLLYGKDHPYGEIMTEETVENITLEDVNNYYNTFFKPNVAYMAVVGDITLKEVKPLLEKHFADWKSGEVPSFDYPMPKAPKMPQVAFVNKPGAVQSVISVFNTIDLKPGSEDVIKTSITNGILGGGFVSKLNLNLREAHAYTYGARSDISSDELVGNFNSSAKVRNEVTDSAITEAMNEVMAMVKGEITEDELIAQKNYSTGVFAYSLENSQTKARFAINTERYGMPKDYYATYLEKLAAVTLEDVKATAKKYIKPMNSYILVVGNQEEVADKVKALSPTGQITFYDTYGNEVVETTLKPAKDGVTAKSVIENYLTAIGGASSYEASLKNLKKITSVKKTGNVTITGAPPITLTSVSTIKGQMMTDMQMNGASVQKQVFNGSKGKSMGMGGNSDMTDEENARLKIDAQIFPEMQYFSEGFKLELKGVDVVGDKAVYIVDITLPNGDTKTDKYAIETGFLIASSEMADSPQGSFLKEEFHKEYKKIGKVMFAFKQDQSVGPQKISVVYSSIEINEPIDASMFE
jgi:predicted Zn-dependent peptidase